jgi:hypothetical protein
MYKFRPEHRDWLKVFIATPSIGDKWEKLFPRGVTPSNQFSLNLYTCGTFKLSAEKLGYSQHMSIGDSSLDIAVEEFPSNEFFIETPVEEPACRVCLTVDGGGKWERRKSFIQKDTLFDTNDNEFAIIIPESGWDGYTPLDIRKGNNMSVSENSFVFFVSR